MQRSIGCILIKYDNERKALELKEQEELNRQHIITLREEEFQRIVQQTIMKKKSTEAIFESLIEHVKNIIRIRCGEQKQNNGFAQN